MASRFAALRGDFDSAKTAGPSDKYNSFGNYPSRADFNCSVAILRYRHARAAAAHINATAPLFNIKTGTKKGFVGERTRHEPYI